MRGVGSKWLLGVALVCSLTACSSGGSASSSSPSSPLPTATASLEPTLSPTPEPTAPNDLLPGRSVVIKFRGSTKNGYEVKGHAEFAVGNAVKDIAASAPGLAQATYSAAGAISIANLTTGRILPYTGASVGVIFTCDVSPDECTNSTVFPKGKVTQGVRFVLGPGSSLSGDSVPVESATGLQEGMKVRGGTKLDESVIDRVVKALNTGVGIAGYEVRISTDTGDDEGIAYVFGPGGKQMYLCRYNGFSGFSYQCADE